MGAPVMAETAPEAPVSKSFLQRLVGVFFSPGETFADIARRPDFVGPLLILALTSVAVIETTMAKIGMERMVRQAMEQSGRMSRMNPDQVEQVIQQQVKWGTITNHLGGVVLTPLFLLFVAGIGLLLVKGIFGADTNFKTAFSVACYTNLVGPPSVAIGIPSTVMALAMILFGDPEHFNVLDPFPTNPGFFLNPSETPRPLLTFLGSLDVFTIWMLVLLAIGFSRASRGKVKAPAIFFPFAGLWLVWVLAKVGLAMIF